MASNSQILSSSASDPSGATDYDISLSFHDDTRYKFTSQLYSALDRCGLKTYMNLDKQTVHDSKFHVVVFSKKYASSPPCLDQLVEIMNYHNTKQRRVIPIFYNIETSAALQNVTSISEKAFRRYDKTPLDADRLANWRAALMDVRNMSGYRAGSKKFQADIISDVVDEVLSEINPKVLNITKYPVGLDSGVNQIIKLLSSDKSQGVIKFGVYGMGGVGKTTLAKSLYNQLLHGSFEGSCFLENFREILETERGLVCLQEKLLNDVLNCKNISIDNADQGFELIKARICSRKVVIVIDDVDNAISLDFIIGPFASGSVVIITTRDEEVLDQAEVEPMYRYMVNVLNDADSLTLFTKHAFGDATPNDTLMMLSRDILRHAGGLPLALAVFGSYLSTQPSEWKNKFLKLDPTDHNDNFELNLNDDEFLGTPSFSSSSPPHIQFDVFISFYGEDTRLNFTSHLYHALDGHGVRTFKDVPELSDKDIISGSLLHAIEYSQTYIVVLSKNYATSSWCLDELVLILNSALKRAERLIIPVFYKLDRSVVAYQSGSYQKALEKHETRFDTERVNKWRHALTEVSDITGFHISENSYDVAMIDEIIDPILRLQVKPNALHVSEDLVGMDSASENIMPSLSSPKNTIQKELLISLDAIELEDHMLKQLFLDIACFFIGSKKEEAVKILETYYSFADYSIDILKKKCLLMINNNDELMMHNLLQDMGREVARNKFPRDEPENHSRLWISEDISKVLTNQMGTEAIECIIHHDLKYESKEVSLTTETSLSFTMETFTWMRRLRFLHLQGGTVSGNFTKTFGDLRWLHWDYCPLTYISSEFHPQNIVILEFPRSMITKWEPKMVFEMLKTIDMSYSAHLVSTPDFNMFPRLKTLYLQGCKSLEELPDNLGNLTSLKKMNAGQLNVSKLPASIGNLSKLVELSLDHSYKLETLPETICNLKALESLSIIGCRKLKELPNDLGDIISLKKLFAGALTISKLPDSIKNLSQLVELDLRNNKNLESLPDNVCNLTALEVLSIDRCTNLKELPTELGNLESLKVLSAECLSITELPDSVGNLHKLIELYLGHNKKLASLPDNICKLTALEILHIDYCGSLESLPKDLGKIESLRKLSAEFLEVEELVGSLKNLVSLNLCGCSSLKQLPDNLGNLTSLKKLNAGKLNVSKVPASIGNLNKLVELRLDYNMKLKTLPDTICNLKALEFLCIDSCTDLKELPKELGNMKSLKVLSAEWLSVTGLPDSVGSLQKLVELKLYGNSKLTTLPNTISNLSSLEILNLSGCEEVNILPNELWEIPSLRELYASGTTLLKKLPDIEPRQIPALPLMKLNVFDSGLTVLPRGFTHLSKLENLNLSGCSDLVSIPELPPNLKSISTEGCKSLEILPNVSDLKQLEYLRLINCSGLMEIQGLEELTSLRELDLRGCNLSLPGNTLTRPCFQLWSGFGHETQIRTPSAYLPEWISQSPYWISGSSHEGSTLMFLELLPNEPRNFLGIILCFKHIGDKLVYPYSVKNTKSDFVGSSSFIKPPIGYKLFDPDIGDELFNMDIGDELIGQTTYYSVKNTKSDFVWSSSFSNENNEERIILVPTSIFPVRDVGRIEVTANQEIDGICLLYKTDEM